MSPRMVLAVLLLAIGVASEALAQAPPAPTPYAPSGSVMNPTPTYKWSAVTGANQYFLEINTPTGNVFRGFFFPASCSAGTCSATPATTLAVGPYNWDVQAQGPGGKTWSATLSFTVIPPPAPVQLLPSGPTYTPTPAYSWNAATGATSYFLEVSNGTTIDFRGGFYASQVCPGGATCSFTQPTSLAQGTHTWSIQSLNASGGTWSGAKAFTVQGPPASTPQAPSGSGTNATPTYRWTAAGGAVSSYVLSVMPLDGGTAAFTVPFAPGICAGGVCSATPPNVLRAGSYTWQVRGWNTTGGGDWSNPMTFTVTGPPMPTPLSPTGSGTNATPTYSWTAVGGGVTFYVLSVNPVEADGTPAFEIWYPPGAPTCTGTTCSVTPANVLKAGPYTWQIRARNAAGPGDLSNPVPFTVTGPPIPNPLSPSGVVTTPVPTFSWSAVAGNVLLYNLAVSKADGTSVYEISPDLSVCAQGTCSLTPNHPLAVGSYTWAVRGRNAAGPGGWGGPLAFAVQAPTPPIPLAPVGKVPTQTPTFSWTVSAGATDYTLSVVNPNGSTVYERVAGAGACIGGICSLTPADVLGAGVPYRWRVRGQHLAGVGDWSALVDFHVASLEDCDQEFVTADFNGDGLLDGLCQTDGDVYVALGDQQGGFGVANVWLVHSFARLLFGDFDGDGKMDLADVNVQTGDFLVARSLAPATSAFAPLASWGIARGVWGSAVYTCQGELLIAGADRFDADALTDVYCRDASLKFFLGTSTGTSFKFKIIDDPPAAYMPAQEYIYAGPRPLAITGGPH